MSEGERRVYLSQGMRSDLERMRDDMSDDQFSQKIEELEDTFSDHGEFYQYSEEESKSLLEQTIGQKVVEVDHAPPQKIENATVANLLDEPELDYAQPDDTPTHVILFDSANFPGMGGIKFGNGVVAIVESPIWRNIETESVSAMKDFLSGSVLDSYSLKYRRLELNFNNTMKTSLQGNVLVIQKE